MTETIKKANLKISLNTFEAVLDATIQYAWSVKEQEHLAALVNGHEKVTHQLIKLGDQSLAQIQDTEIDDIEKLPAYVIHFVWMEHSKSFMILWRDIIFQRQKALVLQTEGKVTLDALQQHQEESMQVIKNGAQSLKDFLEAEVHMVATNNRKRERQLFEWSALKNPWGIYKNQLEQLNIQCLQMLEQTPDLIRTTRDFQNIKKWVLQNIDDCRSEIKQFKILAKEYIKYIKENIEENPAKVVGYLENEEANIGQNEHLQILNLSIEEQINRMVGQMQVSVGTNGGVLLYQEINFQRNARQWMDSETIPLIYEMWELNGSIGNSLKMALINICNRALLFSTQQKEGNTTDFDDAAFCSPLVSFLENINSWEADLKKLTQLIQQRMKNDFHVSEVYDTERPFLLVPLQSTINQYKLTQNPWIVKVKNWWQKQIKAIRKLKTSVEHEESLSVSEKIVRFAQSRKAPLGNTQYSSIFMTKGYIGKSFWVGRVQDLHRFEQIVKQWKSGIRGAVLLTGQRFSGKSSFGEYVSSIHFSHATIRLTPHTTIKVEGRKFNTTYDLEAALDFIQKHSLHSHPLIWVDDLEYWIDPNISLSKSIRALLTCIDKYGSRMFFMVSMGNWFAKHLDKNYGILKRFQAEINLDKMSREEVKKAILIRHGATHKILVDKNNEEPTPQDFQKITGQVYQKANGNIGEALSHWSYAIHRVDDEKVKYIPIPNYSLPDFLNPDAALILSSLTMEKRSTEYRLRKLFGPPFRKKYQYIIQRLISVGVLTRHLSGSLEVNEVMANEVEQKCHTEVF
ncbi:MAG TPA: hypothetical protein ENJ53_08075 [Phaeodactylibacter sp.]|nr:hypothetical protein [Phaeodactylibacter sp.]